MTTAELHNVLRVGFELEGKFRTTITPTAATIGSFGYDSSVHETKIKKQHLLWQYTRYSEFRSKPMTIDDAKNALAVFTPKNYVSDSSCGLHVHVSAGTEKSEYREDLWKYRFRLHRLLTDWEFINRVQTLSQWCTCVRERLTSCQYCKPYANEQELKKLYIRKEKYRVMNFHEQGTIEFRFLAACKHRNKNFARLLNMVLQHFTRTEYIVPVKSFQVRYKPTITPQVITVGDTMQNYVLPSVSAKTAECERSNSGAGLANGSHHAQRKNDSE